MSAKQNPVFVSGADSRYWRCLYQLLRAAKRTQWTEGARWVAYDLGIRPQERKVLEEHFPWCEMRNYDLSGEPDFYKPSEGTYAWKPNVIWDAVRREDCPVIWMDSANLPRGRPNPILSHLSEHGLYILRGQAPLQERCDPKVLERLNVPKWTWGARECVTGIVGMDAGNPDIRQIVERWAELAKDRSIIRPVDCIERHMNDQAVLNALAWPAVCRGELTLPEQDIDISSGRPIAYMSSRNKVPPTLPLWADSLTRVWYRIDKETDQFVHRAKSWLNRHSPLKRLARFKRKLWLEDFSGKTTELTSTFGTTASEPFICPDLEGGYLLFSQRNVWSGRSWISGVPLSDPLAKPEPVLVPRHSLSQPFVFPHQDHTYLLVHREADGGLELWQNSGGLQNWRLVRHLFEGKACTAARIFAKDDLWWLFIELESPVSGGLNRYLALYHTDDPIYGTWRPHPVNRSGHGIERVLSPCDMAGGVIQFQSRLFRETLRDPKDVSAGATWHQIIALTPDTYEERTITPSDWLPVPHSIRQRHLSLSDGLCGWEERL